MKRMEIKITITKDDEGFVNYSYDSSQKSAGRRCGDVNLLLSYITKEIIQVF